MLCQDVIKNFDVDHLAYAWHLIHFELMRLYFDGETYNQFKRPKLGQQIQLQETKDIGSESETTLITGQSYILDDAIETFVAEIFEHTKHTIGTNTASETSLGAELNGETETKSDAAAKAKLHDDENSWKSRYISQVSSFIKEKNVYAINTKHWQRTQATQLLATKAALSHLPLKNTLEVRSVQ